ncbi:LysE family translocator [Nonlabens ponticola]|uniref:LysE family translocator n=1 Tax=Nonlabens ponticola TaxID=2496866 RepID=A0A3S9MVE9_9FLAO|nr:LysE family transporter [Nonlabens ponticola]AZQ43150.1 LysE family translocator [Nonlabens ponticola]
MIEDIYSAIPLGIGMAFLIGPVFFALLETSAIKGFRAALAFDIGVIIADIVFLLVAYFMTSAILEKLQDDPGLFIFGGGILALYGVISFAQTRKSYLKEVDPNVIPVATNNYGRLMIKGFLLNFINVGVLGFWLGLILIFGPQLENDGSRILTFFGTVLASYLVVDLFKIALAKSLNRYLTPLRIFWLKRLIAIIMMICGGVLIFKGTFPDTTKQLEEQIDIMPDLMDQEKVEEVEEEFIKELESKDLIPDKPVEKTVRPIKETTPLPKVSPNNKPEVEVEDDIFQTIDTTKQKPQP